MKGKETIFATFGVVALLVLAVGTAWGVIDGISGPGFSLTAKSGYISTPDGNSVFFWGFANGDGIVQYPGPTLIVNQGDTVTVDLTNTLPVPVSIVFPGQEQVIVTGGVVGLLTGEAAASGGTVSYEFVANNAGTYLYHSGTQADLQVDMGLLGALIVRPTGFDPMAPKAYDDGPFLDPIDPYEAVSAYDVEYLFLLTEMDVKLHRRVELGQPVDTSTFFPTNWFINGRCAPDTMFPPFVSWLPNQPYNCMPLVYPGKRMLMRVIGAGRDQHPYHHHGNHARIIARDGRLLKTAGSGLSDLSYEVFTVRAVPGQTVDAIFTWTGKDLGWDIYGHTEADALEENEYEPDHGKPFPVLLPEKGDLTFGGFWSGSPFMGTPGSLPPGEGGLNPWSGFPFMWHSHTEKEMTNNGIFPGGMMTMMIIIPPGSDMMETIPLVPGQNPIMGKEGGN